MKISVLEPIKETQEFLIPGAAAFAMASEGSYGTAVVLLFLDAATMGKGSVAKKAGKEVVEEEVVEEVVEEYRRKRNCIFKVG